MIINGCRIIRFRKAIQEFNRKIDENSGKFVILGGCHSHYAGEKIYELDVWVFESEEDSRLALRRTFILADARKGKITEKALKVLLSKVV